MLLRVHRGERTTSESQDLFYHGLQELFYTELAHWPVLCETGFSYVAQVSPEFVTILSA